MFVCPNCKNNDDISEISLAWVTWRGQFDIFANINADTQEVGNCPNDPRTYYHCNDCDHDFDVPLELEDLD